MGPTNTALVKLFQSELKLREAQGRLESVSKNVRLQERKVKDLTELLRLAQSKLKEHQSALAQSDLDLKAREEKIEHLREQQQSAKNNREYQAFLVEINTEKVDKAKAEDQSLKLMEAVERLQKEVETHTEAVDTETAKLKGMQTEINDRVKKLNKEIAILQPERDAAAAEVPAKARDAFDRLADRFEGEGMSALTKPDVRREEYACDACNMDLVTDIYNKLHSRDELVFCPSCHRILYIPEDLPVDVAVKKVKERREPRLKPGDRGAMMNRQTSAVDIAKSITVEEESVDEAVEETAIEDSHGSEATSTEPETAHHTP